MNAETSAMYAPLIEKLTDEQQEALDVALAVDPAEITVTILAVDEDGTPVGHAALRPFERDLEVKKVFVPQNHRGTGISKLMMLALEDIARERGVDALILQTGELQTPAIALYLKLGYLPVPAYGRYAAVPFGLCYRKVLD